MTLNDAEKIVHIWGRYEEFAFGKLNLIFLRRIPESFLPFPKDILFKAFDIMASHYARIGNKRGVELMNGSAAAVYGMYVDDEEALLNAANNFNDPKWREVWIPNFKKWQSEWITTQGHFDDAF